jgi:hypothetical protein
MIAGSGRCDAQDTITVQGLVPVLERSAVFTDNIPARDAVITTITHGVAAQGPTQGSPATAQTHP